MFGVWQKIISFIIAIISIIPLLSNLISAEINYNNLKIDGELITGKKNNQVIHISHNIQHIKLTGELKCDKTDGYILFIYLKDLEKDHFCHFDYKKLHLWDHKTNEVNPLEISIDLKEAREMRPHPIFQFFIFIAKNKDFDTVFKNKKCVKNEGGLKKYHFFRYYLKDTFRKFTIIETVKNVKTFLEAGKKEIRYTRGILDQKKTPYYRLEGPKKKERYKYLLWEFLREDNLSEAENIINSLCDLNKSICESEEILGPQELIFIGLLRKCKRKKDVLEFNCVKKYLYRLYELKPYNEDYEFFKFIMKAKGGKYDEASAMAIEYTSKRFEELKEKYLKRR